LHPCERDDRVAAAGVDPQAHERGHRARRGDPEQDGRAALRPPARKLEAAMAIGLDAEDQYLVRLGEVSDEGAWAMASPDFNANRPLFEA
jgi:hypothetical protein